MGSIKVAALAFVFGGVVGGGLVALLPKSGPAKVPELDEARLLALESKLAECERRGTHPGLISAKTVFPVPGRAEAPPAPAAPHSPEQPEPQTIEDTTPIPLMEARRLTAKRHTDAEILSTYRRIFATDLHGVSPSLDQRQLDRLVDLVRQQADEYITLEQVEINYLSRLSEEDQRVLARANSTLRNDIVTTIKRDVLTSAQVLSISK